MPTCLIIVPEGGMLFEAAGIADILFEALPGCVQTCLLDILGRCGTGLASEDTRKVARTHGDPVRQFRN